MAYNEKLAERVKKILTPYGAFSEIKMFGGLCLTLRGNMTCGIVGDDLMVRVGPDRYMKALKEPGARPMDFTGRPMKGFLFVGPAGTKTPKALSKWVHWCVDFTSTLPDK